MKRCSNCNKIIWPWQWSRARVHDKCYQPMPLGEFREHIVTFIRKHDGEQEWGGLASQEKMSGKEMDACIREHYDLTLRCRLGEIIPYRGPGETS